MGLIGHFRKHQQIVAPEALRGLPLIAFFVEASEGDVVPGLLIGAIAPYRSFDATDPDFINGFLSLVKSSSMRSSATRCRLR